MRGRRRRSGGGAQAAPRDGRRRGRQGGPPPAPPEPKEPIADPFDYWDTYLGFVPSTAVTNGLLDLQRSLVGRLAPPREEEAVEDEPVVRWVSPVHLHANLRHLGNVLPGTVGHLRRSLAPTLSEVSSFPIRVGSLALWPEEGEPRAIWALLQAEDDAMAQLRERVDERLAEMGLPLPEHLFRPHVTVALVDRPIERAVFDEQAARFRGPGLGRFWLSEIGLFAHPGPRDGRFGFEQVARFPLHRSGSGGVRPHSRRRPHEEGPPAEEPPHEAEPALAEEPADAAP